MDFRSDVTTNLHESIGIDQASFIQTLRFTGLSESCSGEAVKPINQYKLWTYENGIRGVCYSHKLLLETWRRR